MPRRFLLPEGDGVPLDEDNPGVLRLYESKMLKNSESPLETTLDGFGTSTTTDGSGDGVGVSSCDTLSEEGHVVSSSLISSFASSSREGNKNFAKVNTATAASPPAAAIVTPDNRDSSVM